MIRGLFLGANDNEPRSVTRFNCDHVNRITMRKIHTGYDPENNESVLHCINCNSVVYAPTMWCMPTEGRVELRDVELRDPRSR